MVRNGLTASAHARRGPKPAALAGVLNGLNEGRLSNLQGRSRTGSGRLSVQAVLFGPL